MDERLEDYIRRRLQEGFEKNEIYKRLRKTRYSEEEIEKAFSKVDAADMEAVDKRKKKVDRKEPVGEVPGTSELGPTGKPRDGDFKEIFTYNRLLVSVLAVLILGIFVLNVYLAVFYTPFEEEPEEVAPTVEPPEEDVGEPELLFRENIQDHFDEPINRIPTLAYSEQTGKLYGGTSFGESDEESFVSEGVVFDFDPETREFTEVIEVPGRPQALDIKGSVIVVGGILLGEEVRGYILFYDLLAEEVLLDKEEEKWIYNVMFLNDDKIIYVEGDEPYPGDPKTKVYDFEKEEAVFEDEVGVSFTKDGMNVYILDIISDREPFEQIIKAFDRETFELLWEDETRFPMSRVPPIEVFNGELLLGSQDGLMSYDLETSTEEEVFTIEGYKVWNKMIATKGGIVYTYDTNGSQIIVYDYEEEEFPWKAQIGEAGGETNIPLIAADNLYYAWNEEVGAYKLHSSNF